MEKTRVSGWFAHSCLIKNAGHQTSSRIIRPQHYLPQTLQHELIMLLVMHRHDQYNDISTSISYITGSSTIIVIIVFICFHSYLFTSRHIRFWSRATVLPRRAPPCSEAPGPGCHRALKHPSSNVLSSSISECMLGRIDVDHGNLVQVYSLESDTIQSRLQHLHEHWSRNGIPNETTHCCLRKSIGCEAIAVAHREALQHRKLHR